MKTIARWCSVAVAVATLGCGGGGTGRGRAADAGADSGAGGADASGSADVDMSQYPAGAVYDPRSGFVYLTNGDREDCEPCLPDGWVLWPGSVVHVFVDKCRMGTCYADDKSHSELPDCTGDKDCPASRPWCLGMFACSAATHSGTPSPSPR